MKKLLFAAICCFSLGLGTMMAQDQPQRRGRQGRGMRNMTVQLADTTITNRMDLTAEQIDQINVLNENYANTMKDKMAAPNGSGNRPSREEMQARMEEMRSLRQQANKKLREVLGTEGYIQYLETALERSRMMQGMRGGMHGQGQGQRGGFQGAPDGFGGPGGGFGGPGGGFGEDF